MIPWKWKLYRVSNYILLLSAALIFLKFLELGIRSSIEEFQFYSYSLSLLFLLIMIQSLVNLIILAKTFPDKLLRGSKSYWHLFAMICNALASFAMFYLIAFQLLPETKNFKTEEDYAAIVILCGFFFLFVNLLFVLFNQIELKRILRRNHENSVDSMLESIGKDEVG